MKETVFIIEHKKEQFYFLFNRTLGTVNELIDVQVLPPNTQEWSSSNDYNFAKSYRNMKIRWKHNGEQKEFKVEAILTKITAKKRAISDKLRQAIINYFIENEPDIINVRYKEHLAQLCPYCESDQIEVITGSQGVSQHQTPQYQTGIPMTRLDIKCNNCDKEWTEHLALAFIEPKDSVDNLTPVKRPKKKKSK